MASTYSTNLKIELQATGDNPGTWGTITNTNLGTALEQAIVGYGNPSYASDANLTLTYTNTNAAQTARSLVLNVTSAVSLTATRELVVPTIQKQYIVQNNTTGAQSITVKTSAGTGITVPNGRKAHLYVDGTNVIQMFDFVDINGGTIDGATIGGSSAGAGTFTNVTATGTVNFSGATVSNGGSVTTVDINGGTIDGTTIGGASAGAGTFTTLTATTLGGALNANSQAITNVNIDSGTIDGVTLGTSSAVTEAQIDNINLNGNTISSTDTNGNLILAPNGTGDVQVNADTLRVGDSNVDATITTNGTGDLILNTNSGSSSGSIRIYDGANGDIEVTANGTGSFNVAPNMLVGTTTDFTSTGAAGGVAVSGYGIYPFTTSSGSTISSTNSGLVVQNPNLAIDGSVITRLYGASFAPVGSNSGSGGSNAIALFGVVSSPVTTSSGTTARLAIYGGFFNAVRATSSDLSSNASNQLFGLQSFASVEPTVGAGASAASIWGASFIGASHSGTSTRVVGAVASISVSNFASSQSATVTNAAVLHSTGALIGQASGATVTVTNVYGLQVDGTSIGATATVTNYYALFAAAPTVTGTLTNRWGVYIADASSPNYFAGSVQVGAGTAAAPTLTTIADTDTGVFFPAANEVGVSTGGTERLRVDAAGNLGVGPSTSKVTITTAASLSIKNFANTSGFDIGLLGGGSDINAFVYQRANGYLAFGTNNTERARITNGGNLLVGTTTDFTTTGAAGGVAVSGYGVYPTVDVYGVTNTSVNSSISLQNTPINHNGASLLSYDALSIIPAFSNSGAGGTSAISVSGINVIPLVQSSGTNARISIGAGNYLAIRGNSNDLSSNASNFTRAIAGAAGLDGRVGASASSATIQGAFFSAFSGRGTSTTVNGTQSVVEATYESVDKSAVITNASAYHARLRFGKTSGTDTATVTNAYGFYIEPTNVRTTATVTNYYALFAAAPTVTGTLTNRWGVYIDDASSPNYFAGSVRVGAGTAAAPTLTTIADTNTGVFFPAADVVGVSTNGTERARVKSTGQVRFVPLSADPAGAEAGDVYYNSTTNKLKVYNGSAWVDLH